MKDGFVKVAAVTPKIKVADPTYNGQMIFQKIREAEEERAVVVVFPELCITGYTCGDLFLQETLLCKAKEELLKIAADTSGRNMLIFVGLPLSWNGRLYNVAAAICNGEILGLVPKIYIPNYNEFYEARYFTPGMEEAVAVALSDTITVPMGSHLLFSPDSMPELKIGVELCEDLWIPNPPSISHALAGANLIANLSASDEVTGKDGYRRSLVEGQSARLICGYVYASAGDGESTQDVVYSAHNMIAENGKLLGEAERFANGSVYSEIDIQKLNGQRRRMSTFGCKGGYREIVFSLEKEETELTRFVDPLPFVPGNMQQRQKRCEEILMIQSMGLKKRLEHTGCGCAVIGISGGLDSTLALLVTVRAFDLLGLDRKGIKAVTMPGFGTTDRTYDNAVNLIRCLGADFLEIDIKEAVRVHFRDIGQEEHVHDVTYENGQARERTQILMDIANKENGMVIGTGDMSELALGWATYNGDHMSMYGVNSSVPKTLVRHLVRYYADTCQDSSLESILLDVLDTPVSPELLPPEDGKISQKTEDIVGPYELHDFFLYHMLRSGFGPKKIFRLAICAFTDSSSGKIESDAAASTPDNGKAAPYTPEVILKWLNVFTRRFFSQQFKRSCLPDGPKVGTVAVSPRGDLRMPSDASGNAWLSEIEELEEQLKAKP